MTEQAKSPNPSQLGRVRAFQYLSKPLFDHLYYAQDIGTT